MLYSCTIESAHGNIVLAFTACTAVLLFQLSPARKVEESSQLLLTVRITSIRLTSKDI
jgi:hypothetical protein